MTDLSNPIFHDADKAREWLEARIWPNGPVCPHCGVIDQATLMKGKTTRAGLYQCNACREPFTVTVGTLYERSKIPLNKWLAATHLMMASKKGMSALQIGRMLGFSKKTAWFVCHRIRESLHETNPGLLGGTGSMVEVDETFIGRKKDREIRHGYEHKYKVLALVDRESGKARSMVMDSLSTKTVTPIVRANIAREARLMTDEARHYTIVGREFADHQVVRHSIGEYGRGEFHTNTIEGFFSIFKRGMKGVYQHCSERHLHRYLAEFDFRYNERERLGINDKMRFEKAIPGIVGKRLTYRRIGLRADPIN